MLPVIRQEKVNKVIYDTNVTTLPLIFGGKKVTYLSEAESQNYDFGNLLQQGNVQEIGQEYTNTQILQGQNISTQEVVGQDYTLPQITPVQDYTTTTTQEFTTQIGQTQDFSTQIGQTQDFSTQITQGQDFSTQINSELQNSGFGEYQRTSY